MITNIYLVNSLLLELDAGEAESIAMAIEMKSDLLLIDERRGRNAASRLNLKYIGLLGVIMESKRKGFISSVKPIVDDLMIKAGFWISNDLYDLILEKAGE